MGIIIDIVTDIIVDIIVDFIIYISVYLDFLLLISLLISLLPMKLLSSWNQSGWICSFQLFKSSNISVSVGI